MSIPDYQSLMEPVLRVVARDGVLSMRDLPDRIAVELKLTEEDRRQTIQSGWACWRTERTGRSRICSRPRL
jgi:restriction system protein